METKMSITKNIILKSSRKCIFKNKCHKLPKRFLSDERNSHNIKLLKAAFDESIEKHLENVSMMSKKNEFVTLFHNYFGINKNYYQGVLAYDREVFHTISKYLSKCSSVSNCFQITSRCPLCSYTMEVRELYLHMNIFHNVCSKKLLSVCPFCLDNNSELYLNDEINIDHIIPCAMVFNLDDSPFHDPVSIEWFRLFGLVIRKTRRYFNKPNLNCNSTNVSSHNNTPLLHDITLKDVLAFDFIHKWQDNELHLYRKNDTTPSAMTNPHENGNSSKVPQKIIKRRNTIYYENRLISVAMMDNQQRNAENIDHCDTVKLGRKRKNSKKKQQICARRTYSTSINTHTPNLDDIESNNRICKPSKISLPAFSEKPKDFPENNKTPKGIQSQ